MDSVPVFWDPLMTSPIMSVSELEPEASAAAGFWPHLLYPVTATIPTSTWQNEDGRKGEIRDLLDYPFEPFT